jgi:hypothetical protein
MEGAIIAIFKTLYLNLPKVTSENHGTLQLGPRFKPEMGVLTSGPGCQAVYRQWT